MSASVSSLSRMSTLVFQQCTWNSSLIVVPNVLSLIKCRGASQYCSSLPRKNGCTVAHSSRSSSRNTCRSKIISLNSINCHRGRPLIFVGVKGSRCYTQAASTLTREQLHDLVYRLNEDERELLMNTLKQFESNKQKAQFEAEAVPTPPPRDLFQLGLVNALPFIGFGFLDNFTMIIAGDYIEHSLGLFMCISTMGAAALGNTISDVIGIGSAFYVEKLAEMSGVKPPKLSPIQLELKSSRQAANMGRVIGITIGCLLGMCPLLFKSDEDKDAKKNDDKTSEDASKTVEPREGK
ncbi:transmembrane protein 65 isoform X2 [Topomyia yanbarensis]|uniref:transmembrane protein 65 isoform X2 n=1 Tax=Topomyia yanbarensis TaxID=2498891 RepID=UPI00273BFB6D|nr:transmembrane protein 65 isoform X2 [Topomyia yanbarensis]